MVLSDYDKCDPEPTGAEDLAGGKKGVRERKREREREIEREREREREREGGGGEGLKNALHAFRLRNERIRLERLLVKMNQIVF